MRTPTNSVKGFAFAVLVTVTLAGCSEASDTEAKEYFERAKTYFQQGELKASVIELKNVLKNNPKHADARSLLGQVYVALGAAPAAEKELRKAQELGSKDPKLATALARAALLQKQFDKVLEQFEAAGLSDDIAWLLLRAQALFGLDRRDEAKQAFALILAREPGNVDAMREVARITLVEGDSVQARKQLEQAAARADNDIATWLLKGELELSLQDLAAAEASFAKAVAINPENITARIGMVRASLGLKKPDQAEEHLKIAAERAPEAPITFYLKALLAGQRDDRPTMEAALQEVLRLQPNHAQAQLMSGQLLVDKKEYVKAEAVLRQFLSAHENYAPARVLLGAVLIELDNDREAVEMLQPVADAKPDDSQALALLGTAYMGIKEFAKGKTYLTRAAELAPDSVGIHTQLAVSHLATGASAEAVAELEATVESHPEFSRADFLLILTHMRGEQYDKAQAAAKKFVEKKPDNAQAHNLLGAAFEGANDLDEAEKSYRQAMVLDPTLAAPALNVARMLLKSQDAVAARQAYEHVLTFDQDNPVALVALASIANGDGRAQESISLLERAREKNPSAVEPRLILGNYYLRQRDAEEALLIANEIESVAPDNPSGLLLSGRSQLANGNAGAAVALLDKLVTLSPKAKEGHYQLAISYAQLNNPQQAKKSLQRVLELDADHVSAKFALANLLSRTGQPDQALALAKELQVSQPGGTLGLLLEGDILMSTGDAKRAFVTYQAAFAKEQNTSNVAKLHAAARRMGNTEESYSLLQSWLDKNPDDTQARVILASSLQQDGSIDKALLAYEAVLDAQPRNVLALNNLAWLYHERDDERALELAARAYEIAPQRGEIIDTYGWLMLLSGKVEASLELLAKAVREAPGNDTIRYHYARALADAGDALTARRELDKVLAPGNDFPEKQEAADLLNSLAE